MPKLNHRELNIKEADTNLNAIYTQIEIKGVYHVVQKVKRPLRKENEYAFSRECVHRRAAKQYYLKVSTHSHFGEW
jgi:hypothetical protein